MKNKDYILCEDCKKNRIYYDPKIGISSRWCSSCSKARFNNPLLKIRLTKQEYKQLIKLMEKAECDELPNLCFRYNDKNGELRVIKFQNEK